MRCTMNLISRPVAFDDIEQNHSGRAWPARAARAIIGMGRSPPISRRGDSQAAPGSLTEKQRHGPAYAGADDNGHRLVTQMTRAT